jgi:hypothetical protein
MNFQEIFVFQDFFEKSAEKIQVSLKFDNNKEFCTWWLTYVRDNISVTYP